MGVLERLLLLRTRTADLILGWYCRTRGEHGVGWDGVVLPVDGLARWGDGAVRSFLVAQHEAAHIVVGVAVGLRFWRAKLFAAPNHGTASVYGSVWFRDRSAHSLGLSLMYAAGCAWDRGVGEDSDGDHALLREMTYTNHEIHSLVIASAAILAGRSALHARVARALWERDLTDADLPALMAGETLD